MVADLGGFVGGGFGDFGVDEAGEAGGAGIADHLRASTRSGGCGVLMWASRGECAGEILLREEDAGEGLGLQEGGEVLLRGVGVVADDVEADRAAVVDDDDVIGLRGGFEFLGGVEAVGALSMPGRKMA